MYISAVNYISFIVPEHAEFQRALAIHMVYTIHTRTHVVYTHM